MQIGTNEKNGTKKKGKKSKEEELKKDKNNPEKKMKKLKKEDTEILKEDSENLGPRLFRRSPATEFFDQVPKYRLAKDVYPDSICTGNPQGEKYVYLSRGLHGNNSFFVYGKSGEIFHAIAHLVLD